MTLASQCKFKLLFVCCVLAALAAATTGAPASANYVDPTHIEAISFPSMRMRTAENAALPIEESMHAICVVHTNLTCDAWRALTFENEERVTCHINKPNVAIERAVVHCTHVPSKDERVVVLETVEQDSCSVELTLAPYTPPARDRRAWVPEDALRAEPDAVSPSHAAYRRTMEAYREAFETGKRQIVLHGTAKQKGFEGLCGVKEAIREHLAEKHQQAVEQGSARASGEKPSKPAPNPAELLCAVVTLALIILGLYHVPWVATVCGMWRAVRWSFVAVHVLIGLLIRLAIAAALIVAAVLVAFICIKLATL